MGYYTLDATIQHEDDQCCREEKVRILQILDMKSGKLHCINEEGKRTNIELKDMYGVNKTGVLLMELFLRLPSSFKMRMTSSNSKSYNMVLIKQGLREIREGIIDKIYTATPKLQVSLEENLMYLTVEPITLPEVTFIGRLTKVSFFEDDALMLAIEKIKNNVSVTKVATNFEYFIKEIFDIGADPADTKTLTFDRGVLSQTAAVSLIKNSTNSQEPGEGVPWSDVPSDQTSIIRRYNRSGGAVLTPGVKKWTPYKIPTKKFFFKEFSGAQNG